MTNDQSPSDWDDLLELLGPREGLEASARSSKALVRRRGVSAASDLLRLCFAYVLGGLSLRMLAAWAQERGVASLSDVAMLKRLKASADWVGDLVSEHLAARYPEAAVGDEDDLRLLAVDATMVAAPGRKRDYWLVHSVFDLRALRFHAVEVTDRYEGERLSRGGVRAGELRIGDRGHASAAGLAEVVAGGADFLVRLTSRNPCLTDLEGAALDRLALCREAGRQGGLDRAVVAVAKRPKTATPARLVILPLPPEAAQKARRAARRNAKSWGYQATEAAVEMAGYLLLLTSLPADPWPPDRIARTYRLRWQVELAFKRLKSIASLESLKARNPNLARLWINTALLAALLAEDDIPALDHEAPDSLPQAA
jgi:IS4 transposase